MRPFRNLLVVLLAMAATHPLPAANAPLENIPLRAIGGEETSVKAYAGKVMLVVNVASQCGYTTQYEGLEALWRKYKDQGLVVLGFPSNDFGAQEPGTNAEIQSFCKSRFDVTFPLFEKIAVKGAGKHPLYARLTGPDSPNPGEVKWNFSKFLVGRDGRILERFESDVEPTSARLTKAVEAALAQP